MTQDQQQIILTWLRAKGNNAPAALCQVLDIKPEDLVAAVEAESLAARVAELAPALAELEAAGVDLRAVAREHRVKIAAEQAEHLR